MRSDSLASALQMWPRIAFWMLWLIQMTVWRAQNRSNLQDRLLGGLGLAFAVALLSQMFGALVGELFWRLQVELNMEIWKYTRSLGAPFAGFFVYVFCLKYLPLSLERGRAWPQILPQALLVFGSLQATIIVVAFQPWFGSALFVGLVFASFFSLKELFEGQRRILLGGMALALPFTGALVILFLRDSDLFNAGALLGVLGVFVGLWPLNLLLNDDRINETGWPYLIYLLLGIFWSVAMSLVAALSQWKCC